MDSFESETGVDTEATQPPRTTKKRLPSFAEPVQSTPLIRRATPGWTWRLVAIYYPQRKYQYATDNPQKILGYLSDSAEMVWGFALECHGNQLSPIPYTIPAIIIQLVSNTYPQSYPQPYLPLRRHMRGDTLFSTLLHFIARNMVFYSKF